VHLKRVFVKQATALLCLLFSARLIARIIQLLLLTQPFFKTIKVVAGLVADDGSVKYLPHVNIRLMPKSFYDAEQQQRSHIPRT